MATIQKNRALRQKNKLTIQQINEQLKSLEDQKMSLISSIFKYSTESQLAVKPRHQENDDNKASESSTIIPNEDKLNEDPSTKESHLYQKMASLLSNHGSLHTLSILCQEELGKLDQMINFPLELKVLNGISKLESLQSLKKQKRKSKKNNANSIGVGRRSRKIKKEMQLPGIKNIMNELDEKMENKNDNDLVKSLFEECQTPFDNINFEQSSSLMEEDNNQMQNNFYWNSDEETHKNNENDLNLFSENQIQQQLEVVHNPNDNTRDQSKITQLHSYISVIESMLSETKNQLSQIVG